MNRHPFPKTATLAAAAGGASSAPVPPDIKSTAARLEAQMWKTLGFEDKFQ